MDNQTRQYGYPEPERGPERGREAKRDRPKQYFPDQSRQYDYEDRRYAEPAYREPAYEEPYYEPAPQYEPQYESQYEPQRGSNVGTILLGILAAGSFVAAVSLFFLWRGAAAEADKPPVTETVTQTTTQVETSIQTTTKFPSIFGERDNPTATLPPDEPEPLEPPRDIRDDARDILDQLRDSADAYLQEQQQ